MIVVKAKLIGKNRIRKIKEFPCSQAGLNNAIRLINRLASRKLSAWWSF